MSRVESRQEPAICPDHGEYVRYDAKVKDNWIEGECPQCLFEEEKVKAKAERDEIAEKARRSAVAGVGIPKRFSNKTFENYLTGNVPGKKKALDVCKMFCAKFGTVMANGTNMILCGKPGTGKTHLACAIGNNLTLTGGQWVRFVGAFKAIQTVKDTYRKDSDTTEREAIDMFAKYDLLIIDEVGVQYGTDAEKLILFEIINKRYEDMKPTILISNLELKDLSKYIGERVMDRMKEGSGPVVAFDWESARR